MRIFVGRLGRDPEVRSATNGSPVANFSLATDDKGKAGEKKTTWHNLVAWGKLAKVCEEHLKKGELVFIEGRIQHREFEARDGSKQTKTEIVVQELKMLGKSPSGKEQTGKAPGSTEVSPELKRRIFQRMKGKRLAREESNDLWNWAIGGGASPETLLADFERFYKDWKDFREADPIPDDDEIPF